MWRNEFEFGLGLDHCAQAMGVGDVLIDQEGGFDRARSAQVVARAFRSGLRLSQGRGGAPKHVRGSTGISRVVAARCRLRRMAARLWASDKPLLSRAQDLDGVVGARGREVRAAIGMGASSQRYPPTDHSNNSRACQTDAKISNLKRFVEWADRRAAASRRAAQAQKKRCSFATGDHMAVASPCGFRSAASPPS